MNLRLLRDILLLRSLRWRLTAWYLLLVGVILTLFCASTYILVRRVLLDNFDEILANQANLAAQTLDLANPELAFSERPLRIGALNDEHLIRVYDRAGTLIYNDNREEHSDELLKAVPDALDGRRTALQIKGREGPMRVLTFPVSADGEVRGVLQAGLSLNDVNDTLRALLKIMLILAPTLLLLASGGGLFLADRALRPIDRITRAAQQISAENFTRRLDLSGPDDEVGRLGRTFDAMITRLQIAFEQQRRFTADASHELRTPLTAMIGQIDVALERPRAAEGYRAVLAGVREQAQRLARLVNDLLFLARADARAAPALPEPIDLDQLLPAVIAQLAPLAEARAQTLAYRSAGPLPTTGVEDDLIRLFLNLLDNAIRYTPAGGKIDVAANRAPSGLRVVISDSGPGIAADQLPLIFERFARADRGRNRAQGGSGLGLAIAQSIAGSHRGRILVESQVGQGSTFTVVLPQA